MLHHHLFNLPYPTLGFDISTLEEGAELFDLLGSCGVDFVCHGHRHHPRITTRFENGWRHPVTFLCAGSVAVTEHHRNNGRIPNLFHVVTLEQRSERGAAIGTIDSYEYTISEGWVATGRSTTVPIDGSQRFGSCATYAEQLTCTEDWLSYLISANTAQHIELPDLRSAPLDLQCASSKERKAVLSRAAEKLRCKIFGEYPSNVVLIRE